MAFTKVDKLRTGGVGPQPTTVSMGAYLADGKKHMSKYVNFRITRTLVNELGWEHKDNKLYITINEGSGNDRGFLQLIPDKLGRRTTLEPDTNQGISLNAAVDSFKHYVLNECPVPSSVVTHTVDGNALIIECPDWLRHNPQSEPQPAPEVKIVDMHPGRGHRRRRS